MNAHQHQSNTLADREDFAVLRDVVPRFTCSRAIMVSAGSSLREILAARRPYDQISVEPGNMLQPKACRNISSLLLPLIGLGPRLRSLCPREVDWTFLSVSRHVQIQPNDGYLPQPQYV